MFDMVKINIGGSSRGNPDIAEARDLIRSHADIQIVGFRTHFGVCSNIIVELQAVRFSLLLAFQEGFRKMICKLDAKIIIDLILSANIIVDA